LLKRIETADGSHTLFHKQLHETYHSIHGAIQESRHVFIKHGLQHWAATTRLSEVNILEVGFGTGLNALLTLLDEPTHKIVKHYDAIEPFPLSRDYTDFLNYPFLLEKVEGQSMFDKLHGAAWGEFCILTSNFTIRKILAEIQGITLESNRYDVVYFDAFAPSKQPELWSLGVLKSLADSLKPFGIFVTYSARGQLKRDLKSLGLQVETLKGPPGKAQMVRAIKDK